MNDTPEMTPIPREWTIGRHTFLFEPPDLLWSKYRGGCTLAEAMEIVKLHQELGTAEPFIGLSDMEEADGMDAEARRYISEHLRYEWFRGVIFFNTRLLHRALAGGLMLAAEIARARRSPMRGKVHFVATQAKARTLLAQLRARPDVDGVRD